MFRFLVKLSVVIIGLYTASYVPFLGDKLHDLKAGIFEKVGNVMAEVERVKGKLDETKENVEELSEKAASVKEQFDETVDKLNKASKAVNELIGDGQEDAGEEAVLQEDETER